MVSRILRLNHSRVVICLGLQRSKMLICYNGTLSRECECWIVTSPFMYPRRFSFTAGRRKSCLVVRCSSRTKAEHSIQSIMAHWQQQLNEGNYHGALQLQGRPSFSPGDGSWCDFIFRHMHLKENSSTKVETFLEQVSQCTLTVEEHDVYWKCYVDLCRYYQQPVQPCVYHANFVKRTATQYAHTMAQRGDIEGLDIICHHFSLTPSWEWINILPCTLKPQFYLHLIPWNDVDMEAKLMTHVKRRFEYTGQAAECLDLIAKAFQYLSHGDLPRLQQLREEYKALSIRELPTQTRRQQQQQVDEAPAETPCENTSALAKKERYKFARRIMHLEDAVKMWQGATCAAQQEAEALGSEQIALEDRVACLQAQVSFLRSGLHDVADSMQAYVNASNESKDNGSSRSLEFLQDLHLCLKSLAESDSDEACSKADIITQKQAVHVAKLESQVAQLKGRLMESETKEVVREDINQVSFASMDSILECADESTRDIEELQEAFYKLEKQLQVQTHEHDMERMGDKARIEYLLGMLDETKSVARPFSPTATNEDLALALEVSEERRARAVEDLHRERDLYAEKMKQLMLAVRHMEAQRARSV